MVLVFACLLNSSHHPACGASTDCSAEVQLFKEQKEKATEETKEFQRDLKICQNDKIDLELRIESSRGNEEKLKEDLSRCRGSSDAASKSNADLWTFIHGVGAVFLFISVAFNVVQFFVNQQTHATVTDAEKRAAASDAELNSLKSNALHQHAQFSYMKQFEKFSKEHLDIDVRLKVLETPLALTNGGGRSGDDGGSAGAGAGTGAVAGAGARNNDCGSNGGPSSMPPVQDTDGVRHRGIS